MFAKQSTVGVEKFRIEPPRLLVDNDDIEWFDCGVPFLNDWLRRRALQNSLLGVSKTFVVCAGSRVLGYYCLATGAVVHEEAPGKIKRNMPNPIPVMVLGRLAVDRSYGSLGIGRGLLKDAILRTQVLSKSCGIRALLVHALSEESAGFYLKFGFTPSPLNAMTLMLLLS